MRIALSSGHGKKIRGARGNPVPPQLDEVDSARMVVERVFDFLISADIGVVKFHDDISTTQNENLNRIVNWHNAQSRDIDCSVHFNAFDHTAYGTEVLYVSQQQLAAKISAAISAAGGFTNRGAKKRTDLFFLNNTSKPAVLLETCFCDNTNDSNKYNSKFEAICKAIAESLAGEEIGLPEPPVEPPIEPFPPEEAGPPAYHPTLKKGSAGPNVTVLQKTLDVVKADGDFGSITDTWVRAFQGACGLTVDGIVGPLTWEQVYALQARVAMGEKPLPQGLADQIVTMAKTSEMFDYAWPDRGVPPEGYISGMCLSFAYAVHPDPSYPAAVYEAVKVMCRPEGNAEKDALAWYHNEFQALGMSNRVGGVDTLRHLFVMQTGLGPRESSGRYFCGRDMSATNVESDTCEAGLFQTSWNIRNANSTIGPLLGEFWQNPNGFLSEFKIGLSASANDLNSYGSGDGIKYQWLSRFCPLFHIMVTGVGMRTLRQHWGPINRREVKLKKEMDDLLLEVQKLVESVA